MDKSRLLERHLPTGTVELEGIGTITVRALSRREAQEMHDAPEKEREIRGIALGMVDPKLTVEEVTLWSENGTVDELLTVTRKILELSGMTEDTVKKHYKSDGVESKP